MGLKVNYLPSTYLEVKVQDIGYVDVRRRWRKAVIFSQEISQSKVSVSRISFRKKDWIVEAKVFTTCHSLEELTNIIILLSHVLLFLDQMQKDAGRHNCTRVHHRIMWLIWNNYLSMFYDQWHVISWLTVVIQNNFIEHSARWFSALVFVYFLSSKFFQS